MIERLERGIGPLGPSSKKEKRDAHAALDDVRVAVGALERITKKKNPELRVDPADRLWEYEQIAANALRRLKGEP